MPLHFPDSIQHNNPLLPVVNALDVAGGLKQVSTFTNAALHSELYGQDAKFKLGTLLIAVDTKILYFLSGSIITTTSAWTDLSTLGPVGHQGIQGIQGPIGVQGYQGFKGFQGNIGATSTVAGPQGNQGFQGSTGNDSTVAGPQGFQGYGPQGFQGVQGVQGILGPQGLQGNQGLQGVQGAQGNTGVQGLIGITGSGVQGPRGAQGFQGVTGPAGATSGILGPQGSQGPGIVTAGGTSQVAWFNSSTSLTSGSDIKRNTSGSLLFNNIGSTSSQWTGISLLGNGADRVSAKNNTFLHIEDGYNAIGSTGAPVTMGYVSYSNIYPASLEVNSVDRDSEINSYIVSTDNNKGLWQRYKRAYGNARGGENALNPDTFLFGVEASSYNIYSSYIPSYSQLVYTVGTGSGGYYPTKSVWFTDNGSGFNQRFSIFDDGKVAIGGTSSYFKFPLSRGASGQVLSLVDDNGNLAWSVGGGGGTIIGSGIANYVSRWTDTNLLSTGLIKDDGNGVVIGDAPFSAQHAITLDMTYGTSSPIWGITSNITNTDIGDVTGMYINPIAYTGLNKGLYIEQSSHTEGQTLRGIDVNTFVDHSTADGIGIKVLVSGTGSGHAIQLEDSSAGTGKFLKSINNSGLAQWDNITSSDISNVAGGSGSANYLARWTNSSTLGNSLIRDNGTNVGYGTAPDTNNYYTHNFAIGNDLATVRIDADKAYGSNAPIALQVSVSGDYISGNPYGLYIVCGASSSGNNYGGSIIVNGHSSVSNYGLIIDTSGGVASNHAIVLKDGSQAAGRILTCADSNGVAYWGTASYGATGSVGPQGPTGAQGPSGSTASIPTYMTQASQLYLSNNF